MINSGVANGFGSLFTGGGGIDIAAEMLGYTAVFGVEYDPAIAAVAKQNGIPVQIADILGIDFIDYPWVRWLHASPPCPNFSLAKQGARETDNDLALARKISEFITVMQPDIFTLENVYKYRTSFSMLIIGLALQQAGYKYEWKHVNFADYGVAQSRRRFILVARCDGIKPTFAPPTNLKRADLFTPAWNGWLDAIADLIPSLPTAYHRKGRPCEHDPDGRECRQSPYCTGHFADWQQKRIPDHFKEAWMCEVANGSGGTDRWASSPAATMLAGGGGRKYRAFIPQESFVIGGSPANYGTKITARSGNQPSITQLASMTKKPQRAFIVAQGGYNGNLPMREADEPTLTITANSNQRNLKAFIVNRQTQEGASVGVRSSESPAFTVTAGHAAGLYRAAASGRVVEMNVRATARFQSLPDWYTFPENSDVAMRIIGNAVPPLGVANLCEPLRWHGGKDEN